MTRDYKNVSETTTKPAGKRKKAVKSPKKKKSGESLVRAWVLLLIGVVIGGFASFLVFLKLNVKETDKPSVVVAPPPAQKKEKQVVEEIPKEIPTEVTDRFEFYTILPNREVNVSVEPLEPKVRESESKSVEKKTKAVAADETDYVYVLQAGSFFRFKDADKRKANLALIGVTSKIHAIKGDENQTVYRVNIGPYRDMEKVNEISALLRENNIKSLLVKTRG